MTGSEAAVVLIALMILIGVVTITWLYYREERKQHEVDEKLRREGKETVHHR